MVACRLLAAKDPDLALSILLLQFKLVVLFFKAVHGLAPQYLADDCQLITAAGRRQLRSSDDNAITCVIQRTRTRLGDRSFAVAGPRLWYSLPAELCHAINSFGQYRRALKTHFWNWVLRLVTLAYSAPYKCSHLLTYLLKVYKTAFSRRVNCDVLKVAHQKQQKTV